MQFLPNKSNIDWVRWARFFGTLSLIACVGSIVLLFTKGLNYGIDFAGGAEIHVRFKNTVNISELRSHVETSGFVSPSVQQFGAEGHREFLVRVQGTEKELDEIAKNLSTSLQNKFGADVIEILRVDVVGPQVGSDLKRAGFLAVLYSLIAILIYVALRFEFMFAPGAIIALFHDALVTVGAFALLEKRFDLPIIAAVLTIVGYSINDTIVIYDRVRENMKLLPGQDLAKTLNQSLNETLSRSILTSLTVLLVVVSLFVYGGGVIHDFAFAMIVGVVSGSYSTLFVATPITLVYERWLKRRNAQATHRGR